VKIDDREVPAAIVAHWKQALGGLPDAALSGVARAHTSIPAGFRPGKVPPAQVKQRAGALMDTLPGLPQPLRDALRASGLQGELLCVLSEQALERHAGAWCRAFGPVPTSAAMLLDERPAVRALGFSQMAGWGGTELHEQAAERARDELAESFAPFLRRLGPLFDRQGPAAGGKADTAPPAPALRAPRLAQERDLIIALRRQRQRARQAEREAQAAQAERDALRARLDSTTADLALARAELARVNAALQQTQARIEDLVRQGVQAQVHERLRPWLAPAEQLQQDVQALTTGPLLDEVQALLRRQAEVDRREGLRSALAAELQRTRALLAEVQRARVDALNPLPQLPEAAQRLQAHAAALQARLEQATRAIQVPSPAPAVQHPHAAASDEAAATPLRRLQQTIAAAPTLDALAALRQHLQAAERLALLTPEQTTAAHALLHEAVSRLYDRSALAAGLGQAPLPDARAFPLQAQQAALARRLPCTLVVDGHNLLHLLPALFRPYHDAQGQPTGRARQALAERHPTLHVELWFDGPAHDTRSLSEQVRVHFSGGEGCDRADGAIVGQVRHLGGSASEADLAPADAKSLGAELLVRQVTVVSADSAVRGQVLALGAGVMLPAELGVWF
jgi:hypothetical protein